MRYAGYEMKMAVEGMRDARKREMRECRGITESRSYQTLKIKQRILQRMLPPPSVQTKSIIILKMNAVLSLSPGCYWEEKLIIEPFSIVWLLSSPFPEANYDIFTFLTISLLFPFSPGSLSIVVLPVLRSLPVFSTWRS